MSSAWMQIPGTVGNPLTGRVCVFLAHCKTANGGKVYIDEI
jgi:hypothetical protein